MPTRCAVNHITRYFRHRRYPPVTERLPDVAQALRLLSRPSPGTPPTASPHASTQSPFKILSGAAPACSQHLPVPLPVAPVPRQARCALRCAAAASLPAPPLSLPTGPARAGCLAPPFALWGGALHTCGPIKHRGSHPPEKPSQAAGRRWSGGLSFA